MRFKTPMENVSAFFVSTVLRNREGCKKALHESTQIRLISTEKKMKMIGHQAVTVYINIK
jgi:hypothetical protein